MENIKSEHMSSENSTPIKKNSLKSPRASESQKGGNQQNQQQQQLPKQRRSRSDNHNREFQCGCGKSYLSGAALYTHVKQKHGGVAQSGQQQPPAITTSAKTKSKKSDQNGSKCSAKQDETQPIEKKFDAHTVYDDIINFFTKHIESNSNQKLENNEGYDWILEIFPRHYFTKGTDYFKILKNLENFIKSTNYYSNQMNQTYAPSKTNTNSSQLQANKSDTQLNGKKLTGEDNFGEENTYENDNENESVGGSPNNLKKINKKLSGSTVHNAARNSTATASFDDRHLDGHDNHHFAAVNEGQIDHNEKDHHAEQDDHHILNNHQEFEDSTLDIFDISKDLRITSLNKIFSIFILNISQRVSQSVLIEILVFITLLRKALNEKGWENCSSPLPYDQLRHYMRTPYGYLLPIPGHHPHHHSAALSQQQVAGENTHVSAQEQKKKKKNLRKRKQTDNMTTAESSAALQSKKSGNNEDKNGVLQEEDEVDEDDEEIQEDEEELEEEDDEEEQDAEDNQQSAKKDANKRMVKVENTSDEKQHNHFNSQYEFCEVNSAQYISEISNTFIIECLPEYFKTAISNANELHVIGPSDEGIKNACYILKLIINWMYAFKFSESKLVFQDSADEETELKQDSGLEEEAEVQTKGIGAQRDNENENKRKKQHANEADAESSNDIENDFNNNHGDVSHDNLDGKNSNRYKNGLNSSHRKNNINNNNNNNLNSLYEELEDESKENRHTGNQYHNDLEMIGGSRKHRKLDLDENHNMMLMNGDINGFIMSGNNNAYNQLQSVTDQMKLNNVFNSQQVYHGTPHYFSTSAANSTTYMNNYSNRFYGGDHSTSFYNSGNSTTYYHPPTPAAYYSNSYRNHPQLDYPRSTKFGDQETPKVGYPNSLSLKSAGNLSMMYGNNYIPMSQTYNGYAAAAAAAAFINPAVIYPHMQPVYYPQQVFVSPHHLMAQNQMGDLYSQLGASSVGQHDFN